MWNFHFKTLPVTSPPREWALSMAMTASFAVLSAVLLLLLPALNPALRFGLGCVLFFSGAYGLTVLRRARARAAGVPFTHADAIRKQHFQWFKRQRLVLGLGYMLLFFVPVLLGSTMLLNGHQVWEFAVSDWRFVLEDLARMVPIALITLIIMSYADWSRRYAAMAGCLGIIMLTSALSRYIPHSSSTVGALLSREWDVAAFWIAATALLVRHYWRRRLG